MCILRKDKGRVNNGILRPIRLKISIIAHLYQKYAAL
jgi:hypothetical protein